MDELREPVGCDMVVKSRSKLFFEKKNKVEARSRKCKRLEAGVSQNSVTDNVFPEIALDTILFSNLTAQSLGRLKLSDRACELLKSIPLNRFLLPGNWKVSDDWRPDFGGYVDLYSGKKGVVRLLVPLGPSWAITFEISDDAFQDVLEPSNKTMIESLLLECCIFGFGAAIFCGSFSRAVRPPVRNKAHGYGNPFMTKNMQEKVDSGNQHSIWLSSLIRTCLKDDILFWVENPDSSFFWSLDEWLDLGS